ncbi:MAG: fatty acid CoA ligase family protein [Planctomycetota bacterium]|nr:fatty acid CoA ligase family protein [Planctomycetota bacterium]
MSPVTAVSELNVSRHLRERALERPEQLAVQGPDGRALSFGQLEERCNAIARGLVDLGLRRGDRTCLFVRPSPELIAITHALFRIGAVPVLIDPGMGRRNLLASVERVRPRALIGLPAIHVARLLFPRAFRSVEIAVNVGKRAVFGGSSLASLASPKRRARTSTRPFEIAGTGPDDEAAILFTSGSTGPPKGVLYTHGNFVAQLDALRELYDLRRGEVDAACFPLFALFDNALGMSSVFPDLDPSRPGSCDPARVFGDIERCGATFSFGSPAIWRRLLAWMRPRGERFRLLERITIAGAPVPPSLVEGLRSVMVPGGEVHTPYGATEALPVSSLSGAELAGDVRARVEGGEGTCVGRPAPGIEIRLIRIADEPLERWSDDLEVARGEPGEVCVRGAVVTREYEHEPLYTASAKIPDGAGFWHRMGDVGHFDADGRLWLRGRKSHRLETRRGLLMPVPLENVFNTVAGVRRSALVGVGQRGVERPFLVVEPERGVRRAELEPRLRAKRDGLPPRAGAACVEGFLFKRDFPVDVRHNAKIHRQELKRWAQRRLA